MIADTIRQNATVIAFRERKKCVWFCVGLLFAFVSICLCCKGRFQVWETGKGSMGNKFYEVICICTWRLEHWPPKRKMFLFHFVLQKVPKFIWDLEKEKSDIYSDNFLAVSFRYITCDLELWSKCLPVFQA